MELSEEITEPKRGNIMQSTSKRVRMIFSVMASPNRIDILRILNSKGPLTYSELKALAGFKSKKESGKFAYHLRKLLRQSLVALNKSERRYTITNLGKLVLSLARQIEDRSIIESGKMYVRTSHQSIEEFDSHKIIQSLVREGNLSLELAQKITEEVENRIYKYQTTYLTASLIREMVNSVLLEHGHEEYRSKLARLGLPVFDVQEMLSNVNNVDNGAEGLLSRIGRAILAEHLLTDVLPKDVADSHLSGDLHISNPGTWSLLPDTLFVNIKELLEDGLDLGGKFLDVSRIRPTKEPDGLSTALSMIISLAAKEVSQEVVFDGLTSMLRPSKDMADLEARLTHAFATASTASKHDRRATLVSFRLQLGTDTKIVNAVIAAYRNYARVTPAPHIGLVIDYEKGKVSDVSAALAEVVLLGGKVMFARQNISGSGVFHHAAKNSDSASLYLQSLSINLPRLAFESNKDETYFRARLALLMKPAFSSMELRKKDISDLTRRGLNPVLAKNTQYMQRGSITLVINLIGLYETVFNILGYEDTKKGNSILYKVIETAVDVAKSKGKELGAAVRICMTESDSSARFVMLDGAKYGKNFVLNTIKTDSYSEGVTLDAGDMAGLTEKSDEVVTCNKLYKTLNGGMLIRLRIDGESDPAGLKKTIERAAKLLPSFRPVRQIPICGECGYKDESLADKCPKCKSPYIIRDT